MPGRVERLFTRVHVAVFRATGGRLGARVGHVEQVLLTTTGRRSGQQRTTPLAGMPDGGSLILVASNNGEDQSPAWFGNLVAYPEVTVQRRGATYTAVARVLAGEMREAAWRLAVATYGGYARYATRTSRTIPVIRLDQLQRLVL